MENLFVLKFGALKQKINDTRRKRNSENTNQKEKKGKKPVKQIEMFSLDFSFKRYFEWFDSNVVCNI